MTFVQIYRFFSLNLTSLLALFFSIFIVSCSKESSELNNDNNGPITIKIPLLKNDKYVLTDVSILTLKNTTQVSGQAAEFYYSPTQINNRIQGLRPNVKAFRQKNNSLGVSDLKGIELFTLYYHFEQLMFLDKEVGVYHLNTWPRQVGLESEIFDKGNLISSHNNARYSLIHDAYLFEKFKGEDLNLTINSGVIAHEHFHSLFFKMVQSQLGELLRSNPHSDYIEIDKSLPVAEKISQENRINPEILNSLLRAWNEGFADVWGWIYSGDTQFVERSLPKQIDRNLTTKSIYFHSLYSWSQKINQSKNNTDKVSLSYILGTHLARSIYQLSLPIKNEETGEVLSPGLSRMEIAKKIIQVLPLLAKELQTNLAPEPTLPLTILMKTGIPSPHCLQLAYIIEVSEKKGDILCSNH